MFSSNSSTITGKEDWLYRKDQTFVPHGVEVIKLHGMHYVEKDGQYVQVIRTESQKKTLHHTQKRLHRHFTNSTSVPVEKKPKKSDTPPPVRPVSSEEKSISPIDNFLLGLLQTSSQLSPLDFYQLIPYSIRTQMYSAWERQQHQQLQLRLRQNLLQQQLPQPFSRCMPLQALAQPSHNQPAFRSEQENKTADLLAQLASEQENYSPSMKNSSIFWSKPSAQSQKKQKLAPTTTAESNPAITHPNLMSHPFDTPSPGSQRSSSPSSNR